MVLELDLFRLQPDELPDPDRRVLELSLPPDRRFLKGQMRIIIRELTAGLWGRQQFYVGKISVSSSTAQTTQTEN